MTDEGARHLALCAAAKRPRRRKLSETLRDIAREGADRVSAGEIVDSFGRRAFGALLVVFAAPNAVPLPMPGLSAVLAVPLVFLTCQLLAARPRPWLPAVVRRRSLARADFARLIARVIPAVERLERLIRPRLPWLTEPAGERLIGLVGLALALLLFLPIPFGNSLPGLSLALLGLGLLGRDGRVVLIGLGAGLVTLALLSSLVFGLGTAAITLVQNVFGI